MKLASSGGKFAKPQKPRKTQPSEPWELVGFRGNPGRLGKNMQQHGLG